MTDLFERALDSLDRHFGYRGFRAPQERVIRSVLSGRDTLAVLPTGAGKSVCFQIPALVLGGLTVVVSPLLALMQDQVAAARAKGIRARALNSQMSGPEQQATLAEVARGETRLLYVAPERGARLIGELRSTKAKVTLLAVDEAHCIAEWGPDFRPAYLKLGALREELGNPLTLALTGSATPAVRATIAATLRLGLGAHYDLQIASFDRRNLWFGVTRIANLQERLAALIRLIGRRPPLTIVYGPTRNMVDALGRVLRERGLRSASYHAGLSADRRRAILEAFLADGLDVVAATCAFGMGIDKPNVRTVVHWIMPATPESYYQEAGRAGRDGLPARCLLLAGPGDAALVRAELDVRFPAKKLLITAWADRGFAATLPANLAETVERLGAEFRFGHEPGWWKRLEKRRQAARDRIAALERYAGARRCRRQALLEYFGEKLLRCSGCDHCDREP